jgi:hypothetical protein
MYPILVLLLVEKNRSLNPTYCSFGTVTDVRGGQPPQLEPMSFAPILTSGDLTLADLAIKSPNLDVQTHVSTPRRSQRTREWV